KGANQAVAAARLGASVALVARVGHDAFGQECLRRFRAEGLDTAFVRADAERPTGTAALVVDDRAQNCILVVAWAHAGPAPADVREAAPAIRQADLLLCQLEVPPDATLEALRLARAAGVRTVLTPAPAAELSEQFFRLCDLCVPNETEAELLTGREVKGVGDAEAAAAGLRRRGGRAGGVAVGDRGARLGDGGGVSHVRAAGVGAGAPPGAGDAFPAAVAVFGAEGLPLREAARRASAVAALTVTRPGTQTAFPTRAELQDWPG